ncbi:GlmU family protein [Ohtaekwangia sp.]|uniref:GlmU family protein n=1 Tax=Ohtaekwangia sp. TaxID=2066019 RepID=UPI002FDCA807
MNLILFDDPLVRTALLPFTFTRPVADIRVGILTIREKWERWLQTQASFQTVDYLQKKYPARSGNSNLLINGAVCPDENLVAAIRNMQPHTFLAQGTRLIAALEPTEEMSASNTIEYTGAITVIDKTWKIFKENAAQLKLDFKHITAGRKSASIDDKHTVIYGSPEDIFVEEGVYIRAAILNAESGPIYLGKKSIVQEGAIIRGSFALCEGAHINMGAKIRGDVTVGPFSKVGGEVSTSVIFGYSNKAHDGFLGASVLGEWCNLGADTNTSNLKNNYDHVKLWDHTTQGYEPTGLQFCGLMMGDHSKCSINTMFNTGTVVDVSSNVFGHGFPPNYVPSFGWGGASGFETYQLNKALETAERVMARRNVTFSDVDKEILSHIFETSALSRRWEKK